MTYPQTFDASYYPVLSSQLPLVVTRNKVERHYPSHRHDVMEFSLVLSGEGTEWINGVPHPMKPGTASLILPFQFHELACTSKTPLVLFNCMFGLEMLLASPTAQERAIVSALLTADDSEPFVLDLPSAAASRLEGYFRELLEEFEQEHPYRSTLLKHKVMEILIHLERGRRTAPSRTPSAAEGHTGLASRVLVYMHQGYKDELSLEQLGAEFHLSKTHLTRLLRHTTGKSFVELLHEIRVRHACSLLLASDMTVADVAAEAGFQSVQTFFRVFKSIKGSTPSDYRQKHG